MEKMKMVEESKKGFKRCDEKNFGLNITLGNIFELRSLIKSFVSKYIDYIFSYIEINRYGRSSRNIKRKKNTTMGIYNIQRRRMLHMLYALNTVGSSEEATLCIK